MPFMQDIAIFYHNNSYQYERGTLHSWKQEAVLGHLKMQPEWYMIAFSTYRSSPELRLAGNSFSIQPGITQQNAGVRKHNHCSK